MEIWTDLEVQELLEELKEEKNKAIDEAVKVAVIPLLAERDVLREQIKEIEKNNIISYILLGFVGCLAGLVAGLML